MLSLAQSAEEPTQTEVHRAKAPSTPHEFAKQPEIFPATKDKCTEENTDTVNQPR